MLWFNYVVSFSDGVQKVGVTSQPFYRLQDRLLEAARHGLTIGNFKLSEPLPSRVIAEQVKREIYEMFSGQAMPGHLDWFRYARPDQCDPQSDWEFDQYWKELWNIPGAMQLAVYERTPLDFACKTAGQYHDFCEFAGELASNGQSIRPAMATRLAMTLVRPHEEIFSKSEAYHRKSEGLPEDAAQALWNEYFDKKEALTIKRIQAVLA